MALFNGPPWLLTSCEAWATAELTHIYPQLKRKTFEVAGPGVIDKKMSLDERAASVFAYFKRYNYVMTDSGETVTCASAPECIPLRKQQIPILPESVILPESSPSCELHVARASQ